MVRADKRTDGTVDVLVGNKYGGFNNNAKATYAVKARTVCLPSQTPSPTPPLGGSVLRKLSTTAGLASFLPFDGSF